jgi:hypothetical protein
MGRSRYVSLAENPPIAGLISQARQRLTQELGAQAETLQRLAQDLDRARARHKQVEEETQRHFD